VVPGALAVVPRDMVGMANPVPQNSNHIPADKNPNLLLFIGPTINRQNALCKWVMNAGLIF
jgi:hypothetical protein